jgi:transcriptional regulator with XRE-family HTH domain
MRDYNKGNRIGKILGKRRVELGFTQEYIAFEVGIATSQYQRFEYGVCNLANGYLKHGLKICLLLELDPYELLFEGDVWGDE